MAKPKPPLPSGSGKIAAPRSEGPDPNTARVVFGFRHIVRGFNLAGANSAQASGFVDALRMRSSVSWAQVMSSPRQKMGCEKISEALKVPVPGTVPASVHAEMLCFRFGGDKERFIGYREGATFEVVWIDHAGDTYDHGS